MGRTADYRCAAGLVAALAVGPLLATPPAHADFDDFISAVFDQFGGASEPGEAAAVVPGSDASGDTASVPLQVQGVGFGQPVVDVSIGGGPSLPVALDTGSQGLLVPIWDLNPRDVLDELEHFSFADINIGAFPAGVTVGLDVPTSVDFGSGVVAEHTVVNGLLFSFPFSAIAAQSLTGAPVQGILGIGPNAGGSYLVTADLPGELGKGVLIDEPGGQLVFGAQPDTVAGLNPIATLAGAPFPGGPHSLNDIQVQIGLGHKQDVGAVFDTGGKGGWIPSDVWLPPTSGSGLDTLLDSLNLGSVPGGVPISVYTADGDLLYSYTTAPPGLGGMIVMPDWLMKALVNVEGVMNTGNAAFVHTPVYISNADGGAMTFYGPAPGTASDTVER